MLEQLQKFVTEERWKEARELGDRLKRQGEESETFFILFATICGVLGEDLKEYENIIDGLQKYALNYELYFMLGNYYLGHQRSNLAFLCYEQALHYCGEPSDLNLIRQNMEMAAGQPDFCVNPVTVVILAEFGGSLLRECLRSISKNLPGNSYEVLVVDNQCVGQEIAWVNELEHTKLLLCKDQADYAEAINTAIKCSGISNDIYLLAGDALLMPNALFWLRMCLYERETIGAAGGVSNEGGWQSLELPCQTVEEYTAASRIINAPGSCIHENKLWLEGFSLLIKRRAMDEVGLLEGGAAGHLYSCMDYGMKLARSGYESVLCYNSFIYRKGVNQPGTLVKEDFDRLVSKWKFSPVYYSGSRTDILERIVRPQNEEIRVLEVGCGCGATLAAIRYRYPNAHVYGIELVKEVAAYGTYMADILVGDIETMDLPYENHEFDYIIFGDVLEHLRRPERVVQRMKEYLKPNGRILASIPNLMNIEVIVSLLKGNFTYQDEGILDRTHIHLFTLREIQRMFEDAGYVLTDIRARNFREGILENSEENERIIEQLFQIEGIAERREFEVYQYLIEAALSEEGKR